MKKIIAKPVQGFYSKPWTKILPANIAEELAEQLEQLQDDYKIEVVEIAKPQRKKQRKHIKR